MKNEWKTTGEKRTWTMVFKPKYSYDFYAPPLKFIAYKIWRKVFCAIFHLSSKDKRLSFISTNRTQTVVVVVALVFFFFKLLPSFSLSLTFHALYHNPFVCLSFLFRFARLSSFYSWNFSLLFSFLFACFMSRAVVSLDWKYFWWNDNSNGNNEDCQKASNAKEQ